MKILYTTTEFLCPDLALRLKKAGHDVVLAQQSGDKDILKGTIKRIPYGSRLDGLSQYDFIMNDDNNNQDAVIAREKGIPAIGGDKQTHRLEMDRKFGSNIAKACGLLCPEVIEVKDLEDAKQIIKERGGKWVLKQCGKLDIVKGLNHVAKMDNSEDLIAHIELLQKRWIDGIKQEFILQEKIEGHEFAIGSFWNGSAFMKDKDGDEVCEENFEHKALFPGNLGQSTGEQFTVIRYIKAKESKLFRETLDKIRPALLKLNFRGDFDINSIVTEKGAYFLEFTPRQGVPATSGHIAIQKGDWGKFLLQIAKGEDTAIEFDPRWCIVSWIYTSPFPHVNPKNIKENNKDITNPEKIYEALTPKLADSFGIKVLFKEKLTAEDLDNLHFDSVMFDDKELKIASHDGYIMTVTGLGETVDQAGDKVEKLLKKIIVPKGFWRNDFHSTNYHNSKKDLIAWGYLSDDSSIEQKIKEKDEQEKHDNLVNRITEKIQKEYDFKLNDIKGAIKKTIYNA